jgi:hypothetical protein
MNFRAGRTLARATFVAHYPAGDRPGYPRPEALRAMEYVIRNAVGTKIAQSE